MKKNPWLIVSCAAAILIYVATLAIAVDQYRDVVRLEAKLAEQSKAMNSLIKSQKAFVKKELARIDAEIRNWPPGPMRDVMMRGIEE